MTYKLDPLLPMSESLRRVAMAELEYAESALRSASDRHGGIHSARKCLKRLRALLALIRPGLPDPAFANLTDRFRAIALRLAPARDAHALIDAIDKLGTDSNDAATTPTQSLRAWLMKRRDAAERNLESTAVSDALRALSGLKPAVAGLAIYPDEFQVIAEGLRLRYKAARKSFAEAFATGHDEDFHEWRKDVQHHWRHMQLLAPSWPAVLNARVENARALSQLLGDDHDIALLSRLISTPTMIFGTPDDTQSFLRRCRKRQKALRREAEMRGEHLFADRPRSFVGQIEEHWQLATELLQRPVVTSQDKPIAESARSEQQQGDDRAANVVSLEDLRTGRAS
ncbi:MAG TPA: CHAD domain-containing protein [Methyloceanibacter sp.]|jgi:CHAD domain-containing protein